MAGSSGSTVFALLALGGAGAAWWFTRGKPEASPSSPSSSSSSDPSTQEPGTVAPGEPAPGVPPTQAERERAAVVKVAEGEIGQQNPAKYWGEVLPPEKQGLGFEGAWCGGFALWCLRQAGLARSISWEIGRGFCYRLPQTNDPKPGDIGYIDQPFQHHAVVVELVGNDVVSVDGNQVGSSVKMVTRPRDKFTAFFSIEPLLEGGSIA